MNKIKYFFLIAILSGCASVKYPNWDKVNVVYEPQKHCVSAMVNEMCNEENEAECITWYKKRATVFIANTVILHKTEYSKYAEYLTCDNFYPESSKTLTPIKDTKQDEINLNISAPVINTLKDNKNIENKPVDSKNNTEKPEKKDFCTGFAGNAAATMRARQNGVPMEKVYAIAPSEAHKSMIIESYKSPMYLTDESKLREITEFENRYFMMCIEAIKNKRK